MAPAASCSTRSSCQAVACGLWRSTSAKPATATANRKSAEASAKCEAMLFAGEEGPVASVRDPRSTLPPTWLVYFACEDADACAAAISEAGGAIAIAPIDAPFGRMGAAVDSRGAAFGFIATPPEYEPAA